MAITVLKTGWYGQGVLILRPGRAVEFLDWWPDLPLAEASPAHAGRQGFLMFMVPSLAALCECVGLPGLSTRRRDGRAPPLPPGKTRSGALLRLDVVLGRNSGRAPMRRWLISGTLRLRFVLKPSD